MKTLLCVALSAAVFPVLGCQEDGGAGDPGFSGGVYAAVTASQLAKWGFVDVVKDFGANPGNANASANTAALQAAIDYSIKNKKVCFFPAGTYRINDTLRCHFNGINGGNSDEQTCVLLGSRQGARPTLVLAANSAGFGSAESRKIAIDFRSINDDGVDQPNSAYNSKLMNINVTVEKGNGGAVAVYLRGAQGCGVQDSTIDLTAGGHTGLMGGSGSGGSHARVTVKGGRIGLDLENAQSAPTVTGLTLTGQTETALHYNGNQTLTAVGVRIEMAGPGRAVRTGDAAKAYAGQLSLIDSRIVFPAANGQNVAIASSSSVFLRNTYVCRAAQAVVKLKSDGSSTPLLAGAADGWLQIKQYAHADDVNRTQDRWYSYTAYVNGIPQTADVVSKVAGVAPLADLESKHVWNAAFPSWETGAMIDVTAYGADGSDSLDDSGPIQKAIDDAALNGRIVFIPKGTFWIRKTLKLKPDTVLIGAARHLTLLRAMSGGDFVSNDAARPVIETAASASARTILAFFKIHVENDVAGRAYALSWRCGAESILRCVGFKNRQSADATRPVQKHPFVLVTGHGGGRWYDFYMTTDGNEASTYRHLMVRDTSGQRLGIYQCNPEHATPGEQNVQPNMEILRASHVSVYGLKCESNNPALWITDSDHVLVSGYGGNATAVEGGALFRVRNTPNVLIANAVDFPRAPWHYDHDFSGIAYPPELWHMIVETRTVNGSVKTVSTLKGGLTTAAPAERPVLFVRGTPQE